MEPWTSASSSRRVHSYTCSPGGCMCCFTGWTYTLVAGVRALWQGASSAATLEIAGAANLHQLGLHEGNARNLRSSQPG